MGERGRLIVVEGIDGSGKSTLARALSERIGALLVAEPSGTWIGDRIRGLMVEMGEAGERPGDWAMTLLFMAARAELLGKVVGPALDSGRDVVSDRSFISSMCYQGYAGTMDVGLILDMHVPMLNRFDSWPSICLVVDVSPEEAMRRLAAQAGEDVGGYEADRIQRWELRRGFYHYVLPRSGLFPIAVLDGHADGDTVLRAALDAMGDGSG